MSEHTDDVKKEKKTSEVWDVLSVVALLLFAFSVVVVPWLVSDYKPEYISFSRSVNLVTLLTCASMPLIFFITGIRVNKAWIFNVIGENVNKEPVSGKVLLLYCVMFSALESDLSYFQSLQPHVHYTKLYPLIAMASIYLTSRLLVRAVGLHVYWIARLDGEKLKTEIPDSLILEKLSYERDESYKGAKSGVIFLFMLLAAYLITESFFHVTPFWRPIFALGLPLSFYAMGTCIISALLYENSVLWLQMMTQTNFFDEKAETALKERLSSRLTFLKFLTGLLLLGVVVAFFVLVKLAG